MNSSKKVEGEKLKEGRSAETEGTGRLNILSFTFHLSRFTSVRLATICLLTVLLSSCGVYTFKDVSIPPDVKTIKISYIENKARVVNPQLSPQLTNALQQKVSNQTKLTRVTGDDAHYQIKGFINNYSVSTSGVSTTGLGNQNSLRVGVHITFFNLLLNKTDEFDVSRDFPFSGSVTLTAAENSLMPDITKNLTDEIFNHIFSNW